MLAPPLIVSVPPLPNPSELVVDFIDNCVPSNIKLGYPITLPFVPATMTWPCVKLPDILLPDVKLLNL